MVDKTKPCLIATAIIVRCNRCLLVIYPLSPVAATLQLRTTLPSTRAPRWCDSPRSPYGPGMPCECCARVVRQRQMPWLSSRHPVGWFDWLMLAAGWFGLYALMLMCCWLIFQVHAHPSSTKQPVLSLVSSNINRLKSMTYHLKAVSWQTKQLIWICP